MDILNVLPEATFAALDDLLTFISIYDDRARTRAYLRLLRAHRRTIAGAVCVDAGCGMGYFSEELVRLGARRVYAVEANPHLYALASPTRRWSASIRKSSSSSRKNRSMCSSTNSSDRCSTTKTCMCSKRCAFVPGLCCRIGPC